MFSSEMDLVLLLKIQENLLLWKPKILQNNLIVTFNFM